MMKNLQKFSKLNRMMKNLQFVYVRYFHKKRQILQRQLYKKTPNSFTFRFLFDVYCMDLEFGIFTRGLNGYVSIYFLCRWRATNEQSLDTRWWIKLWFNQMWWVCWLINKAVVCAQAAVVLNSINNNNSVCVWYNSAGRTLFVSDRFGQELYLAIC